MSYRWQQYCTSVIFQLLLPLLPMGFEWWVAGSISTQTLMITTAIYAITVGNCSKHTLLFCLAVVSGIVFSVCYGVVVSGGNSLPNSEYLASFALASFFIVSAMERYTMHIVKGQRCWNFTRGGE